MKKILASFLALLVCFTSVNILNLNANAAVVNIETITEGDIWHDSWSASDVSSTLRLDVDKTGLYNITVEDLKQSGVFYIVIHDITADNYYVDSVWVNQIVDLFVSQEILLVKDHIYELVCSYENPYNEHYADAEMCILFEESNADITTLPACNLSSSGLMVQNSEDESNRVWLKFTPSSSGDYSFNFTNLHAFISIYKASSGEQVYHYIDTEYYDYDYNEYFLKAKAVFNLQANTEYYFQIDVYGASNSKLSITKNSKTVKNIAINAPLYTFDCFDNPYNFDSSQFNYKITYTDNTTEICGEVSLYQKGFDAPEIEYVGDVVYIGDGYYSYIDSGKQPIESVYNGVTTTIYIDIETFTEYLSYLDPVEEYDDCGISYEDEYTHNVWWRINVADSGIYGIWRYNSDSFDTNFDEYHIEVFDENNNFVEYNSELNGWPLVANKDYALSFTYRYNPDYSYNDITFWLEKGAELPVDSSVNGWVQYGDKWVYYVKGVRTTGWLSYGGSWYYLNSEGYMVTNKWMQDSKGWCYLGSNGKMVKGGWIQDSGAWYYINANGYMVSNTWMKDSKGWVYLGSNGKMIKSSWIQDGGAWYYLNGAGYMVSNQWMQDSKGWCYLTASGKIATNAWIRDSKGWCYVGASGYCVTNCWMKDSKGWVYLNSEGRMATNCWMRDSKGWCYLGADGYAVTNSWKRDSKGWCYLDANGRMVINDWLYVGGKWYYLDGNGYMVTGTKTIGGKTYKFNSNGVWIG